jgi:tRNA-dihydrouridine synthase
VLEHTGAAGVMIGRAAQGAPWLPGQIAAALAGEPVPRPPDLRLSSSRSCANTSTNCTLLRRGRRPAHCPQAYRLVPRCAAEPSAPQTARHFNHLQELGRAQLLFLDSLLNP